MRHVNDRTDGINTVQVFIGSKFVGGSTQLLSLIDNGKLGVLLEETAGLDALPSALHGLKTKPSVHILLGVSSLAACRVMYFRG